MAENDSPLGEKTKIIRKDDEFKAEVYRLLNQNQSGSNVEGHYMQVDGAEVKCNATASLSSAKFKIWHVADDNWDEMWILESKEDKGKVVAIENSKVVVKDSPIAKYTSLSLVKEQAPEILFQKIPKSAGSEYCYFKHYKTTDILGFDAAGNAMDPSTVKAKSVESLFSVF